MRGGRAGSAIGQPPCFGQGSFLTGRQVTWMRPGYAGSSPVPGPRGRFHAWPTRPFAHHEDHPTLELADIKKIAAAAEAEALRNQWAVTIAIVDAGGHLLWLQRLDGAAPVSAHIAPAKARARRRWGGARASVRRHHQWPHLFLSAPEIDGLLEGGVPILKAASAWAPWA